MNENNFKAFDKVLVRDGKNNKWMCDFYSQYDNETEYHFCVGGRYKYCIPYEGNENLLDTTDSPKPKRWRAKRGELFYFIDAIGNVVEIYDFEKDADNSLYNIGNYYRTKEEAEKVAERFKELLKRQ